MKRLFWLALIATVLSGLAISAKPVQKDPPKKDPPKDYTNSIGMKFVWIPPGSFIMGSPKEEKERRNNETQHKVTLTKGFYMGVYTVTQEQWQKMMGNNPSNFKGEKNPVETVSWDDCQEFIKKLRGKDKKVYRLPTEAEWEYACRAGTTTAYSFGDDPKMLSEYAWFRSNSLNGTHHPVGQKKANAWGLHDMHGNIYQQCQDWYEDYPQGDVVDPQGPEKGTKRVFRGGAWHEDPGNCRSAARSRSAPGRGGSSVGFRICFSLE